MSPFLLWKWLAFLACIGTVSFVVERLYFLMKSQSMQEISVLLSTSAQILTTFIKYEGTIS